VRLALLLVTLAGQVATIVTPDTILRWRRRLIAQKRTFVGQRPGRPGIMKEVSSFILWMATENPAWATVASGARSRFSTTASREAQSPRC
jgi:hypothetical protein